VALQAIIEQKIDRLDSVPAKFSNAVQRSQKQQLNAILKLLSGLDVKGGVIQSTDANFALVEEISSSLGKVIFGTDYVSAVTEYAAEFRTQADITQSYYTELLGRNVSDKKLYSNMLAASQADAVNLLNIDALQTNLSGRLKNILLSSVANNQSQADLIAALSEEIIGSPEREGSLLRYVKQIARDFYNIGDSRYTNIIAEDLGMEFYMYSAGKVKDSREFCLAREGRIYHKSEIELWTTTKGSEESNPVPHGKQWQGRHPDTNPATIWYYRGGYNCMHSFLPLLPDQVPPEVKDRVKE